MNSILSVSGSSIQAVRLKDASGLSPRPLANSFAFKMTLWASVYVHSVSCFVLAYLFRVVVINSSGSLKK